MVGPTQQAHNARRSEPSSAPNRGSLPRRLWYSERRHAENRSAATDAETRRMPPGSWGHTHTRTLTYFSFAGSSLVAGMHILAYKIISNMSAMIANSMWIQATWMCPRGQQSSRKPSTCFCWCGGPAAGERNRTCETRLVIAIARMLRISMNSVVKSLEFQVARSC